MFFGATVRYAKASGTEREVSVVGIDEVDLGRNHISWVSPLARAVDEVRTRRPRGPSRAGRHGAMQISKCVMSSYPWESFSEPPGAEAAAKAHPDIGG